MLHCLEHLYADSGFIWGAFVFDIAFLLLTTLGERRLLHWGGFRLLDSIDFATLQQPCSSYSPSSFSSSFSSSASSSSSSSSSCSSSPSPSSSSSSSSSSLSSSSTHSYYHHFDHHQFPSSFWSATSSRRCLWLAATPKNHVRPLPHSDFTLLIPFMITTLPQPC